jgi:hypothetical protein
VLGTGEQQQHILARSEVDMTVPKEHPQQMPSLTKMDLVIVCVVGIALLLGASMLLYSIAGLDRTLLLEFVRKRLVMLNILSSINCGVLVLWMLLGGKNSLLWNWLPPFSLVSKVSWARWPFVLLLILGTICGTIQLNLFMSKS